jgi:hypothetical protein
VYDRKFTIHANGCHSPFPALVSPYRITIRSYCYFFLYISIYKEREGEEILRRWESGWEGDNGGIINAWQTFFHIWYDMAPTKQQEAGMFSSRKILEQVEFYLMGARDPLKRFILAQDLVKVMANLGYLPIQAKDMVKPVRMPSRVEDLAAPGDNPPVLSPEAIAYVVPKEEEDDSSDQELKNLFREGEE